VTIKNVADRKKRKNGNLNARYVALENVMNATVTSVVPMTEGKAQATATNEIWTDPSAIWISGTETVIGNTSARRSGLAEDLPMVNLPQAIQLLALADIPVLLPTLKPVHIPLQLLSLILLPDSSTLLLATVHRFLLHRVLSRRTRLLL